MSIMDELKKLTRPYDDDDIGDDGYDVDDDLGMGDPMSYRPVEPETPDPVMTGGPAVSGGSSFTTSEMPRTSGPINLGNVSSASKYRVVLVKPTAFKETENIAQHIRQGDTVIINCEQTDDKVARRVVDFLCGCTYALDGSFMKASDKVIIYVPRDVSVDGPSEEEQAED